MSHRFGFAIVALLGLQLAALPQSIHVVVDPSPVEVRPPLTVPAELLRYPLSIHARHMLQKALELADRGDHARSVRQLLNTVNQYPNSGPYVFSLLGVEYLKMQDFADAVFVLEKSVVLLPHDASNHANLGLALLSQSEYDRARAELKRALELDPHYKMASQLLTALARK